MLAINTKRPLLPTKKSIYGGDTYAVENVAIGGGASPNDEDTFTNGADVIVRITGLVDLSDSTFSSAQNSLMVV